MKGFLPDGCFYGRLFNGLGASRIVYPDGDGGLRSDPMPESRIPELEPGNWRDVIPQRVKPAAKRGLLRSCVRWAITFAKGGAR